MKTRYPSPSVSDLMGAMKASMTKFEELSEQFDLQSQTRPWRDSTYLTPPQSNAASEPVVAANAAYKVIDAPKLSS